MAGYQAGVQANACVFRGVLWSLESVVEEGCKFCVEFERVLGVPGLGRLSAAEASRVFVEILCANKLLSLVGCGPCVYPPATPARHKQTLRHADKRRQQHQQQHRIAPSGSLWQRALTTLHAASNRLAVATRLRAAQSANS